MTVKLYDYFRSSASYRVRIALALKNIDYEKCEVHLVNNGGEQLSKQYSALNPQQLVPTFQDNEFTLNQSLAIIEYLDELYPQPALLPSDPMLKAHVRSLAYVIACDIHPLDNLRVLKFLKKELSISDDEKMHWYHHWIITGLKAYAEKRKQLGFDGPYTLGTSITLADCCLIPQLYNAHRFDVDCSSFKDLLAIEQACLTHPAFLAAKPHI